jgi:stage II sporulation protein AA (anti-sigma F factor antagonist)
MSEVYIEKGSLVVPVEGELDHYLAGILRARIDPVLVREGIGDIVYDLSKTEFMDSSGVGMIMGRHRQVAYLGGRSGVCHVNMAMDRLLRMAGLYRIVEKFESVQEAVDCFERTRESVL